MNALKYCCSRFAEAVTDKEIIHSNDNDETEWFIGGLWHIYYCPFCSSNVKGKGWGQYTGREQGKTTDNKD